MGMSVYFEGVIQPGHSLKCGQLRGLLSLSMVTLLGIVGRERVDASGRKGALRTKKVDTFFQIVMARIRRICISLN